jgi:hypothetical protein
MSKTVELLKEKGYRFLDIKKAYGGKGGKYEMYFIVEDTNGYLHKDTLESFLNEKSNRRPRIGYGNEFDLRNIARYLEVNKKSFVLCDGNFFMDSHWDLKVHCLICDRDFYLCWNLMKVKSLSTFPCEQHQFSSDQTMSIDRVIDFKNEEIANPKVHEKTTTPESRLATQLKEYCEKVYSAETEYEECVNPETGHYLPYDIYIDKHKMFIEVQGPHHFERSYAFHKTLQDFIYQQFKDKIKRSYAEEHGIFVEIDLRKITTLEAAIEHIQSFIKDGSN